MDTPQTLTTHIDGQEAPLGPLAARYALTYQHHPRKAADALRRARAAAQQARQDGRTDDATDWEEVGDTLEAILARKTTCRACGRKLEDPVSVARGIGPDCLARGR